MKTILLIVGFLLLTNTAVASACDGVREIANQLKRAADEEVKQTKLMESQLTTARYGDVNLTPGPEGCVDHGTWLECPATTNNALLLLLDDK